MWGYPATPLLFLAVTAWFLINMLITRPAPSLAGLAFIATGFPVYFVWRARSAPQHREASVSSKSVGR
jgi:APA family basic amino acid/polyamine antiporter